MVESHQLSYYYKHRVERSLYAKEYYKRKKNRKSLCAVLLVLPVLKIFQKKLMYIKIIYKWRK